jgi:hypothetical protein
MAFACEQTDMTAAWAVLWGLLGLVILLLREAIKDMGRGEVQTRLSQLPQALLWLAVRQVPKEWRDELGGEWRSELAAIRREATGTPLTGLAHGLLFAAVLVIRARAIARAYAGRPQALAMVWDVMRRLAIGRIPFTARNRTTQPTTGDFALAPAGGAGSGTISIRRSIAIATGLALTAGTALTLYATRPDHGLNAVDYPIELSSICTNLGGIVAPPAEQNAAYQYRCQDSKQPITKQQIAQQCRIQWGPNAKLVLRDPDSASGWTCHTPGALV